MYVSISKNLFLHLYVFLCMLVFMLSFNKCILWKLQSWKVLGCPGFFFCSGKIIFCIYISRGYSKCFLVLHGKKIINTAVIRYLLISTKWLQADILEDQG